MRNAKNQVKTVVPLSKKMNIKVQKRDNVCAEYEDIKIPDSPVKPIKQAFMMTGMTGTVTENNRDLDVFDKTVKTTEKFRAQQESGLSPGLPFQKSIGGVSPDNRTQYGGYTFATEADS